MTRWARLPAESDGRPMGVAGALLRSLFRVLGRAPLVGVYVRVIGADNAIRRLERGGKEAEARRLRAEALRWAPAKAAGPLWRSEGQDLLYRRKDYEGALAAFEKAIEGLDGSAALVGVTRPDLVYAGAAQAALMAGQCGRASTYTEVFARKLAELEEQGKGRLDLAWHRDVLSWLRSRLDSAPTASRPEGSDG